MYFTAERRRRHAASPSLARVLLGIVKTNHGSAVMLHRLKWFSMFATLRPVADLEKKVVFFPV